jgi:hypothetical protein
MKTIAQTYAETLTSLPVEQNGKPSPRDTARLRLETYFQFWIPWLAVLDPLDCRTRFGGTVHDMFERRGGLRSGAEIVEGMKLMKQQLRLPRLSLSTYFKLVHILREACQEAATRYDVDVALCALIVFVQLELGAEPDPEYGHFPQPQGPMYKFNDADLSDDPVEAELELEIRHDTSEESGTSEYHCLRWFQKWEETIEDAEKFEQAFPGMGHRRSHLVEALRPIFVHLDPVLDGYVLELFLRWAKRLLRSPLEENVLGAEPRAAEPEGKKAAEAA